MVFLIIHVVKPGDSIYTIARTYGVTPESIIRNNEIQNPNRLVVGQTVVIMTRAPKIGTLEVNGYTFPSINPDTLRRTLPNLTYLSIFSHQVNADGTLRSINDVPLIRAARAAGVAPLMVITNIQEEGGFSSDLARTILTNEQVQNNLINNVLATLRSKNYFGLDIDFEYIYPENREDYNNFLRKVVRRLRPEGYTITTALAPKISGDQKGILYEAHDYPVHGALADHVILMTYEWGFTFGPPEAVAPLNKVKQVLDYAVTVIPRNKIFMGIPNYGYDWELPYKEGTAARTVSNVGAVNLAASVGASIKFDTTAQAPFFNYYTPQGRKHIVWFEDARSINAKIRTAVQYRLGGISYWTIGRYFPQNWLVQRSLVNVRKVI